jgi:hypothetical protein
MELQLSYNILSKMELELSYIFDGTWNSFTAYFIFDGT